MFWLHSDIFAISLKFPPNYLGVHRLTNHCTARARLINVTHMPWKARHDRRLFLHWQRAQRFRIVWSALLHRSILCKPISAVCVRQQKPYPPNTSRKCLLCRSEYAYGEAGWTVDEAACYSKGLCSIFSHLFIWSESLLTLCLSRHMKIWNIHNAVTAIDFTFVIQSAVR